MDSELSITQAARLLNRTRQCVHKMYQQGKFPGARVEVIGDLEMIMLPLMEVELFKKDKAS